jgi:RecB family exonuclease
VGKKKIPNIVKNIREYKHIEINYAYQKNISYSQFSMYKTCPKRWSLQYKKGIKTFTSSIHTIFGTALHKILQYYLDVMYKESAVEADRKNLIEMFENELREEYKTQYKKNNNQHFSTPLELREFFEDGVEIIRTFAKKRGQHFSKKGWYLVGCEIPVILPPNKFNNNVIYQGYLDVVMYHEPTNTFKIIDFKTSTNGWNDATKKDENKQFQLILYKKFFSEQFGVPYDDIRIEFFILKRKVYEHPDYNIPRIQTFAPPSGKIKLNKATKALEQFIEEAFDGKEYKDKEYNPNASIWNCSFCPFLNTEHCKDGVKK